MFVANKVAQIRRSTQPNQWHFVSTDKNSADHGKHPISPELLSHTNWFTGSEFLHKDGLDIDTHDPKTYNLVKPDKDTDVHVSALATQTFEKRLDSLFLLENILPCKKQSGAQLQYHEKVKPLFG